MHVTPNTTHTCFSSRHHADDPAALGRDELRHLEWLLTNGTGAYSMGTALGANTRRYHGLLVAAAHPPVGRVVTLNQTIDQLVLTKPGGPHGDGPTVSQAVELSTALFPDGSGMVHAPSGHERLVQFEKGLSATWIYEWGGATITRTLSLHDHEQAATLTYRVDGLEACHGRGAFHVTPLLTLRDFHGLLHRGDLPSFGLAVEPEGDAITVSRGVHAVTLSCGAGHFEALPDWWLNALYPRDTYRGQGDREDYFAPGRFVVPLSAGGANAFSLTVTLGESRAKANPRVALPDRISASMKHLHGDAAERQALATAADDFVVRRSIRGEALSTIMAGYPWFADWGRDTFIALPGLLLTTGRHGEARDVLKAFAAAIRNGLVPNRFDDYDDAVAHYNTVDGSLWYVQAGLAFIEATGDRPGWLIAAMNEIVDAYARGTEAQGHDGRPIRIAMDHDGLIAAGDEHSQLTWMDAACGGVVFTPRPGKCVEINALWYNALLGLSERLADDDAATASRHAKLAAKVKRSFIKTFWSNELDRLIDHVTPTGQADAALRPNMVFACSLPFSPLPMTKKRRVLAAIREALLTPMGLRTLPADDPNYHPRYGGPQFERDRSYHQGTVWPWLIGPYAEGILRANKFSKKAKIEAAAALKPLRERLLKSGVGQLHEIFDAEPGADGQHEPRGCPAQAWSVAELVRASGLIEHGEAGRPH